MKPPWIHSRLLSLSLAALLLPGGFAAAQEPPSVSAKDRQAIVDDIAKALNKTYVFPDVAKKMEEHLRAQLRGGAYDSLGNLERFTQKLTEDLRSVSHDLHIRVGWAPDDPPGPQGAQPSPEERRARFAAEIKRENACFRELKLLSGNVGYLRLDCFAPADLGGSTAVAAMSFLGGSDALIFDLRNNGGGSPSMIQLLSSYLLPGEEPTHLNSFFIREGDRTEQYWTQAWVPGSRLAKVPVFVLTSKTTFSAAEEFTYNLKNLKRATIVGETTGGGAHPVDGHRVEGYPVFMSLPFGRAINPITGTNWEGTGVAPDVDVAASEALEVAHGRALSALAEVASDTERRQALEMARTIVEGRRQARTLSAEEMAAFAGTYGVRRVFIENGALWYQRGSGRKQRLTALANDRFLVGELDDFLIRFEREGERIVRLIGIYADGREEPSPRD